MDERPQATDNSPSLASPAMKGPKSEASGASIAAGAKAQAVGRLIGERAFHFSASTSPGAIAGRRLAVDPPFAPGAAAAANLTPQADLKGESVLAAGFAGDEAMTAKLLAGAVPPLANANAPAPIANRAGAASNRATLTREAAHEAARNGRKPEVSAPRPVVRVTSSAAPAGRAESSAKTADGRPPDPATFGAPSTAQTSPFGAQLSAPFAGSASFEPDASATSAANADVAPRANALGPGAASSASPVREIDVDLSPGGLEDVSMTMRLTGDKLSVVIHAASSQTLGSIEGARDAITDRMAAIGQPLELARCQTDGRQHGWEYAWKRAFR